MATRYEKQILQDTNILSFSSANHWHGQTFTPAISHKITEVHMWVGDQNGTPGTINCDIYLCDVSHRPTGASLASGTFDGDTVGAGPTEMTFDLGIGTVLTAGIEYCFLCNAPDSGGADFVRIYYYMASDLYAGGEWIYSDDNMVSWEPGYDVRDLQFEEWGIGAVLNVDTAPVDKQYSKRLVAIGGDEVWIESAESGIATGGTATSLLDSTRSEAEDYFNDWTLTVISGTGVDETATITNYISATGAFEFAALSGGSIPNTTSRYIVAKMAVLAAATGLDTTDVLNVAVAAQKMFVVNGTIKKVLDFVNIKLSTLDISSGANLPPDFGTVLTCGTASMIVDYITAIDDVTLIYGKRTSTTTFADTDTVIGTNPTGSPYEGAVSFVLDADEVLPPHWYNYTVFGNNTDGLKKYGVMPTRAYEICRYRGRIQLCRDPNYPHQWYQSRQLNPFDFLFVPGDAQSPVHGNQADCAEVGDIVVTAIPYSDDILVYGCANELWVMHGDAAFGGELDPLDKTTGILGDRAWCWDDKVNLYMMCTVGLLRIPQGFGQTENLTRELYPDFISDLAFDPILHRITLAFSANDFGIHIFRTTLTTGACIAWWYDLRTEGLFPDAIPTAMGVYSAFYYQSEISAHKKLLVGCADGYLKSFDKATKNDDGTTITSYIGFAPLALSTHPRKDGIIKNIDIVTGIGDTDSDGVTCTVHIARTAAQIIKKLNDGDTAAFTKVFITPNWSKSNLDRRSIRGQWGAIVLTNNVNTESWSMERLIVDSKEIGRSL